MASWWGGKVRQVRRYLGPDVSLAERDALATRLTPAQLTLFDTMHPADQRHGLEVMACLASGGHGDPDVLLAGLFHDAAKGRSVGLAHRVAWSLGERYGGRAWTAAAFLPGFRPALEGLRHHADRSADLALAAGCSTRTAELIRFQAAPRDVAGEALRLADEA